MSPFHSSDASCVHISFRFIGKKGTSVKSEKEECVFETCHDRDGIPDGQEGIGIPNQGAIGDPRPWREPVKAHMTSGRVRNLKANGKRSLSRWMLWGQL